MHTCYLASVQSRGISTVLRVLHALQNSVTGIYLAPTFFDVFTLPVPLQTGQGFFEATQQ